MEKLEILLCACSLYSQPSQFFKEFTKKGAGMKWVFENLSKLSKWGKGARVHVFSKVNSHVASYKLQLPSFFHFASHH